MTAAAVSGDHPGAVAHIGGAAVHRPPVLRDPCALPKNDGLLDIPSFLRRGHPDCPISITEVADHEPSAPDDHGAFQLAAI
jgi:hypothetical protein